MPRVFMLMGAGSVIGLMAAIIIVHFSGCGEVPAAAWGGGLTNAGLALGGVLGLYRMKHSTKGIS
jgi:hypothetical protein